MLIRCLAVLLCLGIVPLAAARPQYTCYQLGPQRTLTIDGDLSDWPNVPVLLLGQQSQVSSGTWAGPNDSHAKVRMTWDQNNLYMAIEVIDNVITQNLTRDRARQLYTQDALQWAVDLRNDGGNSFGDDNFEYGFGVADGQPIAYRWFSSSGWPNGVPEHIKLAIKPHPQGGLIYEAQIDYSMVTPLRNPEDGHKIGFNIVLQDQDDDQHKTLQWTPGIADGKKPSAFGTVIFSHATPSAQGSGVLLSANKIIGADGLDVTVMSSTNTALNAPLTYQLNDASGRKIDIQSLVPADKTGVTFTASIPTKALAPSEYVLVIRDKDGKDLTRHRFTRSNIEQLDSLIDRIHRQSTELETLIKQATAQGMQTKYPLAALTTAKVFDPFIAEDIKLMNFELALHNAHALDQSLALSIKQLQDWMVNPAGVPTAMHVPDIDYTKVKIKGRNLVVDDKPVLLVGPGSWLWQVHKDVQNIADVGYNYVKFGWMGQNHFDNQGQLIRPKDMPFWASNAIFSTGHANKMAVGIEMMCPDQVWRGAERRGELTLGQFHEIYDQFAAREISKISKGKAFDYTISVEKQRCPVTYEPKEHQALWGNYLTTQYGSIEKLNSMYHTTHANFADVPFPTNMPENTAQRYDWVRLRQMMIANELTRAGDVIRKLDPDAVVHGYPYVWTFREPAAYYDTALDPELDTANMDMVGCDTSGAYYSDRYAMSTIGWLAGYYDLMHSIAQDRPLAEGEFHYVNRRKIYPDNWARAIYFQAYIHGLSYSSSWVWARSGRVDCALLLDANVLLGSGQAALDLQRTAESVAAFHTTPADVTVLYSNASSPHTRRDENGVTLSQSVQSDMVYEGMFFHGMQTGFITEQKIAQGLLKDQKLLIVPNSSYVEKSTRDAIESYARGGGCVVLVGDCLQFSPQGEPLTPMANLPTITRFEGFADMDQARTAMSPILKKTGVLPAYQLKVDNGKDYPTVEWRRAVDDQGRNLLFVLNLGYEPATITLPATMSNMTDLLDGHHYSKSFELGSLQFKLLRQ